MAGYSGTPLPKKLGIKPGHRVALVAAPEGFADTLGALPEGVRVQKSLRGARPLDVVVMFSADARAMERRLPKLKERLAYDGGIWLCWPKKASGVATDLSDAVVRRLGIYAGLVDNKTCAVDETWSGLRFVYRVKDRPKA